MTTIPCRKKRFKENLESILNQTYNFDKFVIVMQSNFSKEDFQFFEEIATVDPRIELLIGDVKWRSCNKLLPTLEKYPDDIIITIDDDTYYPPRSIETLVEEYRKNPDCIICHQSSWVEVDETNKHIEIKNISISELRFGQKTFDRYLSNCCLFPPGAFNNTDLFNFCRMFQCVKGTHDEWWFWVNSTMNSVQSICVDYVKSMCSIRKTPFGKDEPQLCVINTVKRQKLYNDNISKIYFDKLWSAIQSKPTTFIINSKNEGAFKKRLKYIKQYYRYNDIKVIYEETGDEEIIKPEPIKLKKQKTSSDFFLKLLKYSIYKSNQSILLKRKVGFR